jgi:hypothetical protein
MSIASPPADPEAARAAALYELELKAKIAEAQQARAEGAAIPATGGNNGSAAKGKCPICGAAAALDTDAGHAPWCKLQHNPAWEKLHFGYSVI